MNIYDDYNIEYENTIKNLAINIISENNKFFGILMDNNELVLEVHYDKQLKNFSVLNGSLGKKLQSSDLSVEMKLERILELFDNKLSHYFNPVNTTKIKRLP